MKDAIAIWWDTQETSPIETSIELDINLWISDERKHYIEFGIRIKKPEKINKVNLFLPYKISKKDVENMVEELVSPDLANALFYDNMTVSGGNGKLCTITGEKVHKDFDYYFYDDDDIDVSYREPDGSIISLEVSDIGGSEELYCRIRVNEVDGILRNFSKNVSFLEGLLKDLVTIEISVNSIRKLPRRVVNHISNNINLKSINMFLMSDISTEIIFHSHDIKSSRILEDDIWNNYLRLVNNKSRLRCLFPDKKIYKAVAYQWKAKAEELTEEEKDSGDTVKYMDDYNLFVKFNRVKKAKKVIILSIITIIFLSIVGNLATKKVEDGINYIVEKYNTTERIENDTK